MENHHVAAAWRLLHDQRYDFLASLPDASRAQLRRQVITMVLATDMKNHFELVTQFGARMGAAVAGAAAAAAAEAQAAAAASVAGVSADGGHGERATGGSASLMRSMPVINPQGGIAQGRPSLLSRPAVGSVGGDMAHGRQKAAAPDEDTALNAPVGNLLGPAFGSVVAQGTGTHQPAPALPALLQSYMSHVLSGGSSKGSRSTQPGLSAAHNTTSCAQLLNTGDGLDGKSLHELLASWQDVPRDKGEERQGSSVAAACRIGRHNHPLGHTSGVHDALDAWPEDSEEGQGEKAEIDRKGAAAPGPSARPPLPRCRAPYVPPTVRLHKPNASGEQAAVAPAPSSPLARSTQQQDAAGEAASAAGGASGGVASFLHRTQSITQQRAAMRRASMDVRRASFNVPRARPPVGAGLPGAAAAGAAGASAASGALAGSIAAATQAQQQQQGPPPLVVIDDDLRALVWKIAIKSADLGHLASPRAVHERWVSQLQEEFFRQGDLEKAAGMPVSPLFDRDKPGICVSQPGFFNVVALPLYCALASHFPGCEPLLEAVRDNLALWLERESEQVVRKNGE
eukprot:CAMPEP_0202864138 /NCGR_PEP_ID=MMETSP1391-20130828/4502_1 /ASSEMBLY_ACC=CAM_ASM_000867 /TAXON_ID=1034604 /ORGANISM="Chlamydomonas leiostraca, Strain SAG 11-49" /LENGTH=569 /DNA_ID=CAMNT_0049543851 /DNA_START=1 /DNA_END=1710 /DNA_ORIENTATION=+